LGARRYGGVARAFPLQDVSGIEEGGCERGKGKDMVLIGSQAFCSDAEGGWGLGEGEVELARERGLPLQQSRSGNLVKSGRDESEKKG